MISTAGGTALTVAYDLCNEEWVPDLSEEWFGDPASRMSSNAGSRQVAMRRRGHDHRLPALYWLLNYCTGGGDGRMRHPLKTKVVDVARMKNRPTS